MPIAAPTAGARILASDLAAFYNLIKGVTGSGEQITLIYNADSSILIQPSSDPAADTHALTIKNNAGTVLLALTFDGKIEAADGSVTKPSLAFDDDIDTGLYRVGANDIAITTGGTQRLRLDTSGVFYLASQPVLNLYAAGSSGAALTIDWNNGDTQSVTLTANCTFTFSSPVSGRYYTLRLAQDATGSRTATWPATVKWAGGSAPTLTTTASRVDVVSFLWDGTNYLGQSTLNFTV